MMGGTRLIIMASTAQLLVWTLLIQLLAAMAANEPKWSPEYFPKEREFGDETRMGPEIETVEPLGRLAKLKTLFDPVDVNSLNTKFTIHTRLGSSNMMAFIPNGFVYSSFSDRRFHYNLTTMVNSNFDPKKRTVILISGFMTPDRVAWIDRMKDLWLELEDCNVIAVTWKDGSNYVYSRAAATTPRVARQITIFLHYLAELHQDSLDSVEFTSRIHFIGHSLGAHIGGFVGQDLGGRMGRIVALDAAGPSFDQFGREHRLDPSDARLVEAIHTNSGKMKYASLAKSGAKAALSKVMSSVLGTDELARSIAETFNGDGDSVWFGIDMSVGHVDYFANNGKLQPGCTGVVHICDHGRSHHLYEGILHHELALRAAGEPPDGVTFEQWRKDKRLLSINAADYAGFASGEALNQRCPAMLRDSKRLSGLAELEMPRCTLPIDQLAKVDELIEELGEIHGVAFDASAGSTGQRYYLKTLADEPFVGDHYLLRVKLERSSTWDKSCALQAEISFGENRSTTIELDQELRMFINGKFYGLSLPFVNPYGGAARLALDEMLKEYTIENQNQNKQDLDEAAEKLIEQILPSSVALKIIQNKSQSKLSKWIKGSQPGPECTISIDSVQVHPLVSLRRSLFGLYSTQRPSTTTTRMLSHLEYERRKQAKNDWPESLTPAHQNHDRRLRLVVIG